MTNEQNTQLNNWVELHNSILNNIQGATKELELLYKKKNDIIGKTDKEIVDIENKLKERKKELDILDSTKESQLELIENKRLEVEKQRSILKEEQDKQKEVLAKIQRNIELANIEFSNINMNVQMLKSDKAILSKEIDGLLLLRAEKNELLTERSRLNNEIRELSSGIDTLYKFKSEYRKKALKELEDIENNNEVRRKEFENKMEEISNFKQEIATQLIENYKKEQDIKLIKERLEKFAKDGFNLKIKI